MEASGVVTRSGLPLETNPPDLDVIGPWICGMAHADPGPPWQNGSEELFNALHFQDAEERRYQLRLYEMHYAAVRPHQGLGGLTPLQAFQRDYPLHATSRMLGTPSPYSSCQVA